MKRLTDRDLSIFGTVQYNECFYTNCNLNCSECEVQENVEFKLKEYEDLEEQGLLLKLPCKVGDKVYVIAEKYHECRNRYQCEYYDSDKYLVDWCKSYCPNGYKGIGVVETEVYRIHIWDDSAWMVLGWEHKKLDDIGKTVFLTKEEAEAKLQELQNGVTQSNDGVKEGK